MSVSHPTEPIVLPDETRIRQRLVVLATEANALRSLLRVVRRHRALTAPPAGDGPPRPVLPNPGGDHRAA